MTVSNSARGEHTPKPGANWEQHLVRTETVIPDDAPDPRPNRKTRRAQARAAVRPTAEQPARTTMKNPAGA